MTLLPGESAGVAGGIRVGNALLVGVLFVRLIDLVETESESEPDDDEDEDELDDVEEHPTERDLEGPDELGRNLKDFVSKEKRG